MSEAEKRSQTTNDATGNAGSLEDNFKQLEQLIRLLETDDISLEDAFNAYSQGMEVLKNCSDQIDKVEKQVLKLSANGQLETF